MVIFPYRDVINMKLQRVNIMVQGLDGDIIFGWDIDKSEFCRTQVTNGWKFSYKAPGEEGYYVDFLEAMSQCKGNKVKMTANDLILKTFKNGGFVFNYATDRVEVESERRGFSLIGKKEKITELREVKTLELVPTYGMDSRIVYLTEAFKTCTQEVLEEAQKLRGVDLQRFVLAVVHHSKPILTFFEDEAKAISSPDILYTQGEEWQVPIVKAFLSQQESADKLTKMLKAQLEWPGSVSELSGAYYSLGNDSLEDLITKYARK